MTCSRSIFNCPVLLLEGEPRRLAGLPCCGPESLALPACSCIRLGLNVGRFFSPLSTATSSFACPFSSTRRWTSSTRLSPQASTFSTAGVRSASAMYGATSFFFTAAVALRALCSSSQLSKLLLQLLLLLLQAIGHLDQFLNPCQHLEFLGRHSFSRDLWQRVFFGDGHSATSVVVTAPRKLTSPPRVYKQNSLRLATASCPYPSRSPSHRPSSTTPLCPGLLSTYSYSALLLGLRTVANCTEIKATPERADAQATATRRLVGAK